VPLWSSEAELAQAVLDETNRQGWQARVAVADTVGLAWGAARFGQVLDDPLPNPSLAADRPWLIDELPVAALRVEPQTVELLQRLGIEQVGQLLGLPRASLVPRFGAGLLRRLDQLTGRMNEPLVACTEAPPLEASFEFETSIAHAATVLVVLDRLVGQVATAARNQQLGVLQMVATIECDDHSVPPLLVRVLKPTAAERQLVELLRLQAEGLALRSPVKSLRVRVLATGRLECRQTELFATGDESVDWHQMALLVNRLANRLGDNRVVCAERRPSHLPERMVAYAPAVSTRARSFTLDTATASRLRSRPLWLRTRPQRISVTTSGPDERPTHIVDRHRQHDIVEAIGPERIETGWWRDRHRRRDYYRVETSSGDWWWIYRDLRRGMWFAA
jgi:protein ImuB